MPVSAPSVAITSPDDADPLLRRRMVGALSRAGVTRGFRPRDHGRDPFVSEALAAIGAISIRRTRASKARLCDGRQAQPWREAARTPICYHDASSYDHRGVSAADIAAVFGGRRVAGQPTTRASPGRGQPHSADPRRGRRAALFAAVATDADPPARICCPPPPACRVAPAISTRHERWSGRRRRGPDSGTRRSARATMVAPPALMALSGEDPRPCSNRHLAPRHPIGPGGAHQ